MDVEMGEWHGLIPLANIISCYCIMV
jgi:hypothetical protein